MRHRLVLSLAVLLACAALTSAAALVRKRSAATISLVVSSLRVPLDASSSLDVLQAVRLRSIVLANFHEVRPTAGTIVETTQGTPYERIEVGGSFGNVRLDAVSIRSVEPTGPCAMTMSSTGRMSLKVTLHCPTQIRLAVGRSTVGACNDCRGVRGDTAASGVVQRFTIQADGDLGDEVVVRGLHVPGVLGMELASAKEIETRGFATDRMTFEELRDGRLASSVLAGTIRFPDFPDRSIELNRGDAIRFGNVSELRLRSLAAEEALALTITGNFANLEVDSAGTRMNRVPSWLEWCYESQPVPLFFGGVIWLIALVWNLWKEYENFAARGVVAVSETPGVFSPTSVRPAPNAAEHERKPGPSEQGESPP